MLPLSIFLSFVYLLFALNISQYDSLSIFILYFSFFPILVFCLMFSGLFFMYFRSIPNHSDNFNTSIIILTLLAIFHICVFALCFIFDLSFDSILSLEQSLRSFLFLLWPIVLITIIFKGYRISDKFDKEIFDKLQKQNSFISVN